jgi:nitrogen fixation NifU-like protein
MFSPAILDHFEHPRNAGELADATAVVDVENPVCGDILRLAIRVENGRIAAARFQARGCVVSMACASLASELLAGRTLAQAREITPELLENQLGGLEPATRHGARLACDGVEALLARSR